MAGQWAGATGEDTGHRREEPRPPVGYDPGGVGVPAGRRPGDDHGGSRRSRRRVQAPSQRGHGGPAALVLLGLPLLGAFADEAMGPGIGLVFAVCAVLGAAGAAALTGRAGWWWVLTGSPPAILAVTAMAELVADSAKYQGSKALSAGVARWAINEFPVMLWALGGAVVVILVRIARDKGDRRG